MTYVNWSKSDPSASLSTLGLSLQVTEKLRVEQLTRKSRGEKISVGIKAELPELQRLLQQTRMKNPWLRVRRKEQRQRERPWKLVWAWTWALSADCVSREAPARAGSGGWQGCRNGIAVREELLSWTGNVCNDFPPMNAKLGYRDRAEGRSIKPPHFMLKLFC